MNRQQALEWLVQNITKWPVDTLTIRDAPSGWHFVSNWEDGDVILIADDYSADINENNWLDATDNMPHSDCESVFDK